MAFDSPQRVTALYVFTPGTLPPAAELADPPLTEAEQMQEAVAPQEESLGRIWRQLIPESPPQRGAGGPTPEGSKQPRVE